MALAALGTQPFLTLEFLHPSNATDRRLVMANVYRDFFRNTHRAISAEPLWFLSPARATLGRGWGRSGVEISPAPRIVVGFLYHNAIRPPHLP